MGAHPVRLTKHHGAGNDFLVLVDPAGAVALGDDDVRLLCHRHLGVGADGLIRVLAGTGGADLTMDLRNADGSPAEMSGNGIRCLAQAAAGAGLVPAGGMRVATPSGVRTVELTVDGPCGYASVDMGRPVLGGALGPGRLATVLGPAVAGVEHARAVEVGNPHVVLWAPGGDVAVAVVGPLLEAAYPAGANVEVVRPGPGPGELRLDVWERGAGVTLACGTGSCAAVAAARAWGLVGDEVRVHNPGGPLDVRVGEDGSHVLGGPVRQVAWVTVDLGALRASGARPAVGTRPMRGVPADGAGVAGGVAGAAGAAGARL